MSAAAADLGEAEDRGDVVGRGGALDRGEREAAPLRAARLVTLPMQTDPGTFTEV